jgi:hypothetical protein
LPTSVFQLHAPATYPTSRVQIRAYTVAAFRVAQASDQLSLVPMRKDVLDFLIKGRALGYWLENRWLERDGDAYRLTKDGLVTCQSALAAQLKTHNTDASTVAYWVEQFQSNAALGRHETFDV